MHSNPSAKPARELHQIAAVALQRKLISPAVAKAVQVAAEGVGLDQAPDPAGGDASAAWGATDLWTMARRHLNTIGAYISRDSRDRALYEAGRAMAEAIRTGRP
jgi:hypothetical protein